MIVLNILAFIYMAIGFIRMVKTYRLIIEKNIIFRYGMDKFPVHMTMYLVKTMLIELIAWPITEYRSLRYIYDKKYRQKRDKKWKETLEKIAEELYIDL